MMSVLVQKPGVFLPDLTTTQQTQEPGKMPGLPRKHPLIARPKATPPSEQVIEAGKTLQLGSSQNLDTLTVSEASLIINAVLVKRGQTPGSLRHNPFVSSRSLFKKNVYETNHVWLVLARILHNTLNYCDAFARYRTRESIEAVERLLSAYAELAKFERAQLGKEYCHSCPDVTEADIEQAHFAAELLMRQKL